MDGHQLIAGRYELRSVLGRGGMAEVRDGWDNRLCRAVAIKLLYPAFNAQTTMRRRFQDETRAAAALNHPNIVAVHDCGEHEGMPFIVMERLPGETLADQIARGPLPPRRVRAILDDVLSALAAAHAAGILHRDIKPGNILYSPTLDTMKVADFGIAKTAGITRTLAGQVVGTMAYLSPQRVAGAPGSVADDLYAVGVVGYEALTGHLPFPQQNIAALAHAILTDSVPPLHAVYPDVDPDLGSVIELAMARDPQWRFDDANRMRAALAGDANARPVVGVPVAAPSRPPTKVLVEPVPAAPTYVIPAGGGRGRVGHVGKVLAAAAVLVALALGGIALALDSSSMQQAPEPVTTGTPVPPPETAVAPPPAVQVVDPPPEPGGEPGRGSGKRGGGNGKGKPR